MLTEQLVSGVLETAQTANAETLDFARVCLLDWLGCTVAGAREPIVELLVADADRADDDESSPLFGRIERVSQRDAVLINGTAGHALDYDDGHAAMSGHPAVAIVPTLLAIASSRQSSGEQLLRAIVAGYEAAGRIGTMLAPNHYDRGFHATGTVGAMAAALGGACLADLDPDTAATALGLAATRSAGLKASFGSDGKPLHAGWAGLVGFTSVRWAQRGMTACADVLGHKQGVIALSDSFDREVVMSKVQPHIHATSFKQHAACGVTHPSIRTAQKLREEALLSGIERVTIRVSALADNICNIAEPIDGLQLKFSLRGVVAMSLLGIATAETAAYSKHTAQREELRNLIARTVVELDPNWPIGPAQIDILLTDGRRLTANDKGSEILGLTDSRTGVTAKFMALVAPIVGEISAEAMREAVITGPLNDLQQLAGLSTGTRTR